MNAAPVADFPGLALYASGSTLYLGYAGRHEARWRIAENAVLKASCTAFCMFLVFSPGWAPAAQAQASAGAAGPADVQSFGDWTVRCFPARSISPCDIYEQFNEKTSHRLVMAISIAYVPSQSRHTMQIMVPLGVSIARGAKLQTRAFISPTLHYHHCDRAGCYIELIMPDIAIKSLEKGDDGARITIMAGDGHAIDLPVSLKGFALAHDTMMGLAQSRAEIPAAAPPGTQTAR